MPVILQTEAAECGLACITMVGCFFGHMVDLSSLRRRYPASMRGINLKQLMVIASELGFISRPLRLDIDQIRQLSTPCLLHWDLKHFVVLKHVSTRHIVIHDPAKGMVRLSYSEFSEHFTGVALELTPSAEFEPTNDRDSISLRDLTGKVRGLKSALAQVFFLALALEAFALVGPLYLQWVVDRVVRSADEDLLTLLVVCFVAVELFQAFIATFRAWYITWLGATLNVQLLTNMFAHLVKLPLSWYEKRHVGHIESRFESMHAIQRALTVDFVTALLDGLMACLTLGMLSIYSLKLTAVIIAAFMCYALLRWFTYKPLRYAQEEQLEYQSRQQSELLESVRGAQTLKLLNQQQMRTSRYSNSVVETINRLVKVQRLNIAFTNIKNLIFNVGRITLIWIAASMIINRHFTVGMLVAFVAYSDQFVSRAASLIDKGIELRMLRLHADRVADIALSDTEMFVDSKTWNPLPEAKIEVKNISFRHGESQPWILKNCSFTIHNGESVVLVGPSGCGKTTLAKIILGLLQPQEGKVLYGGIDIREIGLGRYRQQIGAVMQDDQLFAGSIAENIAQFDERLDPSRVEYVAKAAEIHDEIATMTMGYQSLVGDMGSTLSGGQKQRILLARALYNEPAVLVLDEATSHLDVNSERKVNATIERLNVTRIVIAHRPETIARAQRILFLDNGSLRSDKAKHQDMEIVA
jgi:ATP-binding cassette, subfamily B, bacterial CvaB/MchF/RaxB